MRRRRLLAFVALTLPVTACGLTVTGVDPAAGLPDAGDCFECIDNFPPDHPRPDGAVEDATTHSDGGAAIDAHADEDAAPDADASPPPPPPPPFRFGDECPVGTIYDDDFTTDPTGRWLVIAGTWEWSAANHTYTLKQVPADGTRDVGIAWIGPRPQWKNYDVDVTETITLTPSDHGDVGPLFRVVDIPKKDPQPANDGSMFLAAAQQKTSTNLILGKFAGGGYTQFTGNNDGYDTTKLLTVHAKIAGSTMKAWLNDDTAKSITATDATYPAGSIGIRSFRSAVVIKRVTVTCR